MSTTTTAAAKPSSAWIYRLLIEAGCAMVLTIAVGVCCWRLWGIRGDVEKPQLRVDPPKLTLAKVEEEHARVQTRIAQLEASILAKRPPAFKTVEEALTSARFGSLEIRLGALDWLSKAEVDPALREVVCQTVVNIARRSAPKVARRSSSSRFDSPISKRHPMSAGALLVLARWGGPEQQRWYADWTPHDTHARFAWIELLEKWGVAPSDAQLRTWLADPLFTERALRILEQDRARAKQWLAEQRPSTPAGNPDWIYVYGRLGMPPEIFTPIGSRLADQVYYQLIPHAMAMAKQPGLAGWTEQALAGTFYSSRRNLRYSTFRGSRSWGQFVPLIGVVDTPLAWSQLMEKMDNPQVRTYDKSSDFVDRVIWYGRRSGHPEAKQAIAMAVRMTMSEPSVSAWRWARRNRDILAEKILSRIEIDKPRINLHLVSQERYLAASLDPELLPAVDRELIRAAIYRLQRSGGAGTIAQDGYKILSQTAAAPEMQQAVLRILWAHVLRSSLRYQRHFPMDDAKAALAHWGQGSGRQMAKVGGGRMQDKYADAARRLVNWHRSRRYQALELEKFLAEGGDEAEKRVCQAMAADEPTNVPFRWMSEYGGRRSLALLEEFKRQRRSRGVNIDSIIDRIKSRLPSPPEEQ